MFKAMNEKELMMVNGGFYYVPKYKVIWQGSYYKRVCVGTAQVASGSGITYYLWNGVRYVAYYD